jgi:alpha-ketoglutarate-dependent taurine dioxygenase
MAQQQQEQTLLLDGQVAVEPRVTPPPPVTTDPAQVKSIVERHGLCILDLAWELGGERATVLTSAGEAGAGDGTDAFKEAAETIPERIFGEVGGGCLLAKSGSVLVPHDEVAQNRTSTLHCDAIVSYGEQRPDYLFLMCASASDHGGANTLSDGLGALEGLRSDPSTRWVAERLESTTLELTTTHPAISADGSPAAYTATRIIRRTPSGRRQVLHAADNLKSLDTASEEEQALDAEMLAKWSEAIAQMEPQTVALAPGEILVVDNFRYFHGREPFTMEPTPRALWQKWMWTATGQGLPFGQTPESLAAESTHAGGARFNPAPRVKPYTPPGAVAAAGAGATAARPAAKI